MPTTDSSGKTGLWQRIIRAGIQDGMSDALAVRIRLANISGILMGAACLPFSLVATTGIIKLLFLVMGLLYILMPLMARSGYHSFARLVLSIGVCYMMLFTGTLYGEVDVLRTGYFRLFIFAQVVLPLGLFTNSERGWKWTAVALVMLAFFSFDTVDEWNQLVPTIPRGRNETVLLMMRFLAPAIFFAIIILSYIAFQRADSKVAQKALNLERQQVDSLMAKEFELQMAIAQAQQAIAQAEADKAALILSKQETEARTAELEATRENTRRLIKRLRLNQAELEGKQAEQAQRQYVDMGIAKLAEAGRWRDELTLEQWADELLGVMMTYVQLGQAALYMADDDVHIGRTSEDENANTSLRLLATYAFDAAVKPAERVAMGQGTVGEAARSGQMLLMEGLRAQGLKLRVGGLLELQPEAIVILPLLYNDTLMGVLEITCLQPLTPTTRELLQPAATALAGHLYGARSQSRIRTLLVESQARALRLQKSEEELRSNIRKIEDAQRAIALQEANMAAVINNTEENILLLDRQYRIVLANRVIKDRYAQYGLHMDPGTSVFSVIPAELHDFWKDAYDRGMDGERVKFTRNRMDAGVEHHIEYVINPTYDSLGDIIGCTVVSRDVTDRVSSEIQLRQMNDSLESQVAERTREMATAFDMLRTTLESTSDGILVANHQGGIISFNQRFLDIWRVPTELATINDEAAMEHHILSQLADPQQFTDLMHRAQAERPAHTSDLLRLLDGRWLTLESNRPQTPAGLENKSTDVARVWSVRDITAQKEAEQALLTIAQAIPVPIIVTHYDKPVALYVNQLFEELFGFTAEEVIGQNTKFLYNNAEDIARFSAALRDTGGNLRNFELGMRHRGGESVLTVVSSERIQFKGEDAIIFGFQDISERQRAERELREANQTIEAAFADLKAAQQQLALSEKLSLMGTLTAGIAHEINTPLSAVQSSSNTLRESVPTTLRQVRELLHELPDDQRIPFEALIERISESGSRPQLSTREERAIRNRLSTQLAEQGVADADSMARTIVESGFGGMADDILPLLTAPTGARVLHTLVHLGRVFTSLENISVASDKTRNIVKALKRYTHTGNPDQEEPVNLAENLQTILILYAHQIRKACELETVMPDRSLTVRANADQLGQVWTNLITNALQAMEASPATGERGSAVVLSKLKLELLPADGAYAEVKVTDTGSGIPEDILPKIFDPFFTTKAKGEGTGMGLQITRQIIEGFGGTIWVESQPGRTTFTVKLPLLKAENGAS